MYTDIKTYEDACRDQNRDPNLRPDVSMLEPGLAKFLTSAYELAVINRSINKDDNGNVTKANWNNRSEEKWSNFMNVQADDANPSGSGLSFSVTGFDSSNTDVASRLTCRDEERSEYFFEQFKKQWEDYILDRD